MRLMTHYLNIDPSQQIDNEIESAIEGLNGSIEVETAEIVLERSSVNHPPVAVRVLIVTPGPDIRSEGRDYTPTAAFNKAWDRVIRRSQWKAAKSKRRSRSSPRRSTGDAIR